MRSDGLLNGDERSQERELLDYLLEQEGIEFFGEKKIARRSPDRPIPLSFAQERLWFLDQLQPASSTYNLPIVMRASGTLDVDLLRRSLSEIVRRHEVLRTRFI